ncbi:MAG: CHAP domain-containing protein [Verrucomicrobium sp.]|nr:CHAP domain-containing protein [Verrucomicrobium sp.]
MITTASQLPPPPPPSDATLLAKLADVAEGELGVAERPPGSNRGPRVETYQAVCHLADSEPTGWPWCAAFVCWCVKQFVSFHPGFLAAAIEANPPREASVYGLEDWGRRIGLHFSDDPHRPFTPQRGDLVFYRFSHVEIVRRVLPDHFETVGGNTNATDATGRGGEVAVRTRSFQLARCFARLTPRAPQLSTPLSVVTR